MPAVNAATDHVLSTRSPVGHGHRPVSCDRHEASRGLFATAEQLVCNADDTRSRNRYRKPVAVSYTTF